MKSVLIVLALACSLFAQDAAKKPAPAIKTDITPGAPRYQLFVNPNVRADTFLLDTATGRIWLRTTYTDIVGDPDVWVVQQRIDSDEELAAWVEKHTTKAAMKAYEDALKAAGKTESK